MIPYFWTSVQNFYQMEENRLKRLGKDGFKSLHTFNMYSYLRVNIDFDDADFFGDIHWVWWGSLLDITKRNEILTTLNIILNCVVYSFTRIRARKRYVKSKGSQIVFQQRGSVNETTGGSARHESPPSRAYD